MAITQLNVERFSITSSKSFGEVVKAMDAAISHPDVKVFLKNVELAKSFAEIETLVHNATGPSDFMEFIRFDLGESCERIAASRRRVVCVWSSAIR